MKIVTTGQTQRKNLEESWGRRLSDRVLTNHQTTKTATEMDAFLEKELAELNLETPHRADHTRQMEILNPANWGGTGRSQRKVLARGGL